MTPNNLLENPFTPTFGEIPAYMAGRDSILQELLRAYSASNRHPSLTAAITGARGSGKTALMSAAAILAEQQGWIAIRTVASPGMLDDILISTRRCAAHIIEGEQSTRVSGIEVAQILGLEIEHKQELTNWRNEMTIILEQLAETQTGLLICVDELQPKLPEMIQLAAIYQLFITEGRKVALLMAGLPHNMLSLEKDKSVSFLRRAQKYILGRIEDYEAEDAIRRTIESAGRSIEPKALDIAVNASEGFPFMMQLVGFRIWDRNPQDAVISVTDAEEGAQFAQREMKDRIIKITYDSLSVGDKAFLQAMVNDGGNPTTSVVAQRLGKSTSYATQYKNRLLGQGIIGESADGTLNFQLPLMCEYIIEQNA